MLEHHTDVLAHLSQVAGVGGHTLATLSMCHSGLPAISISPPLGCSSVISRRSKVDLPDAAGTDPGDLLARGDVEVQIVEHHQAAEGLADTLKRTIGVAGVGKEWGRAAFCG